MLNFSYRFNRLTEIARTGTSPSFTRYHHNPLGQRDFKSGTHGRWWFAYSPSGQLLSDFQDGVHAFTDYVYVGGVPVAFVRERELRFIHTDHLGRPEIVQDGAGTVRWQARNGVFDRQVVLDQVKGLNIGFPGQFHDLETELYYNYFRYYDSSTGRYIQSDPLGLAAGTNTFSYVRGNPISRYDPFGLKDTCTCTTTPPEGPPGTSIARNIQFGESLRSVWYGQRLQDFYIAVRNNGTMDYKQVDRRYQEFGNFNYGVVGTAAGFGDAVLLRAAGFAQYRAGTSEPQFGTPLGLPPYGDDPEDQRWIRRGIDFYHFGYYEDSCPQ